SGRGAAAGARRPLQRLLRRLPRLGAEGLARSRQRLGARALRESRLVSNAIGLAEVAEQQKDNLCGPYWAARILRDFGIERWDGGHFFELSLLLRGPGGTLVLVRDSYPTLGWGGEHLQPPRALAAALDRGDGREGGVLAVVPSARIAALQELARELGLEVGIW